MAEQSPVVKRVNLKCKKRISSQQLAGEYFHLISIHQTIMTMLYGKKFKNNIKVEIMN